MNRLTYTDAILKSTSNPEWIGLSVRARGAHNEIERWSGRRSLRGRVPNAKQFKAPDWRRLFLTTRGAVDDLCTSGWARWDGEDLILLGTKGGPKR